jgi:gas vesicle protein
MPTDMNYLVGRLHGLNELVKILKDLVGKKGSGSADVIEVITNHISDQLNSILAEVGKMDVSPEHKPVVKEIKQKHEETQRRVEEEEPPTEEKLDQHSKTVDDLLRDLENLKGQD